jgi:hypothetical protein
LRIFIDESGTFTRGPSGPALSLVGALVVPDYRWARIQRHYAELRPTLPRVHGEVKGRGLDERGVAAVVELLRENEALFEVLGVDLAREASEGVILHQARQAVGITAGLTPTTHANVRAHLEDLRRRLEALTPQLYVQSVVMFELIYQVLWHATIYFCQRQPKELGSFRWVIDGKQKGRITDWEDWWTKVVLPILQSKSVRDPTPKIVEGDYSYMERFEAPLPNWLPRPAPPKQGDGRGTNIRLVLMEHFEFSTAIDPGLELVDVLVNAVRRALLGNLGPEGFRGIASLILDRRRKRGCLIPLTDAKAEAPPYASTLSKYFEHGKRPLFTSTQPAQKSRSRARRRPT